MHAHSQGASRCRLRPALTGPQRCAPRRAAVRVSASGEPPKARLALSLTAVPHGCVATPPATLSVTDTDSPSASPPFPTAFQQPKDTLNSLDAVLGKPEQARHFPGASLCGRRGRECLWA